MTSTLIISLIILIALIFFAAIINTLLSTPSTKTDYKYQKNTQFITQNEFKFYRALMQTSIAKEFIVFTKIRLADLITPQKGSKNWQSSFNKIQSKHVDFVLCNPANLQPVLIIELDDKTHDRPDRKERDAFVDQALKSAGIPILHTRTAENIENQIAALIPTTKAKAKK